MLQDRDMSQDVAGRAAQLMLRIQDGPIRTGKWHWLSYNFDPRTPGFHVVGAPTTIALALVDARMPGYAEEQLRRLEALGGRERNLGDYRQILAWYSELLVLQQLALHPWPSGVSFAMEPVAGGTKANPEVVIELAGVGRVGVEVKAPDLLDFGAARTGQTFQLNARGGDPDALGEAVTLPRDNPVKDFLVSADKKFAGFRASDEAFRSILVIVWDDFVNEPLTALLAPGSGLFTSNSFHQLGGMPVTYPNLDAVVLVRHQHQFRRGLANDPLVDGRRDLLDYGTADAFPFPALIMNPSGKPVPEAFIDALHAVSVHELTGAEYGPGETVMWTTTMSSDAQTDEPTAP